MKKILFLFLLVPAFCFGQNEIRTMVLHGDTLFVKNWSTNDSIQLNRVIPSQAGQSGKVLSTTGTNYQWVTQSGGSPAWGGITGTLSSQTDLQSALDGKQASGNYATGGGTATGTNTGDNAVNTLYSGLVSNATHTGDATGSTALTLATVNSNVGSFTNANITVNAKGLITAASNGSSGGAPTYLNLASNFSNSTTTQTAVTGWSFAVTAGKTYRIEIIAAYQTAATTTGGTIGVYLTSGVGTIRGFAEAGISQSAVATELKVPIRVCTTLGAAGSSLTSTGVTAINSPHSVYLLATFTCTTSGTLQIGWASEVAASAAQLNANSTLLYQLLN